MFSKISRQNQTLTLITNLNISRRLSSLLDRYNFVAPSTLRPQNPNPNPIPNPILSRKKAKKPPYKPPSSLDRSGQGPIHSDLPFDFRFSYTESSSAVKPIGLREPKHSPFGPGRVDRPWTGFSAPAVDPTVRSVDGGDEVGPAKEEEEERRRALRKKVLGEPLTDAERGFLIKRCQKHRTKRQVNLGRDGLTRNMLNDIHNSWKNAEAVRIKCLGVPTIDMKNVCTQLEGTDRKCLRRSRRRGGRGGGGEGVEAEVSESELQNKGEKFFGRDWGQTQDGQTNTLLL